MSQPKPYLREQTDGQPNYLYPGYKSTVKRSPSQPLLVIPHSISEITGPVYGHSRLGPIDGDLTAQHQGEPLGERIVVSGRVMDENGRAVPNTLVEIWQCNAAGRYIHSRDQHPAPLDPNFTGAGRVLTDENGEYKFISIKPGAYPWRNHHNAWRPAHIHLSLFGPSFITRLVTQMYFPGDPLFEFDPIFKSAGEMEVGRRIISRFDMETTVPEWALGYKFDIILRGRDATPMED
jgi:protocatechuate 3,4-dioxygenase beta subunit